ncbi:Protein of unknown function [Cnuella takakiae]|uniref:DUF3667 domain-containing protein n=1 Tax=Cnuella takakiae TaxID=1302690 RepID=A0A1M5FYN3_9BACT|nr:DUF3667 domain-containing protein [Cnuella takakiae]SHF96549.1 Protein of unknown function [Cnuella takakiae]
MNCGTTVAGRYCQQCGQENVVSHMHFFALTQHFVFDIFHFDGKFFDTLRYLLFRPGYVPAQFMAGRRISYLDPVRMYLFTSALFFLFFYTIAKTDNFGQITGQNELSKAERFDFASRYLADGRKTVSDTGLQPLNILIDSNYIVITDFGNNAFVPVDSVYPYQWQQDGKKFAARKVGKDSDLQLESKSEWLEQGLKGKWKKYKSKFDGDTEAMISDFSNKLVHRFPYLLFLSLPFFAAILKLLYRRKKQLFYFDHAVFTLYHYVFSFILLLLVFASYGLEERTGLGIFSWLTTFLVLAWPVHLLFAMKRFYVQGWGRTVTKFVLLNIMGLMVLLLLFLFFLFYSVYTI